MATWSTTPNRGLLATLATWFGLISMVSCASVGLLTYYVQSQGILAQRYNQLDTVRDEKIRTIDSWSQERRADLGLASRRDVYIDYLKAAHTENGGDQEKALAALTRFRDAYGYHAVFMANLEGQIVATTETLDVSEQNLPLRREYLERAIDRREIVFSDVLISKVHYRPTMFFVGPVFSHVENELIGAIGILANLEAGLYPRFTGSKYLGTTGEVLLVNKSGIAQSPLLHRENAVARIKLVAEPATRGANGQTGHIAAIDYRAEPVMAAYGMVPELNWGVVVKQDVTEINAPIRRMARDIALTTTVVFILAIFAGYLIARSISGPAAKIAAAAKKVGEGRLDVRAESEGPREIQQLAQSINVMVGLLSRELRSSQLTAEIYAVAGRHSTLHNTLGAVLPALADATKSQSGVIYVADDGPTLQRILTHGQPPDSLPAEIRTEPPDHVLATTARAGEVRVLWQIPESAGLRISTQAGQTTPRNIMTIPLMVRGRAVGVIGLASVYEYSKEHENVARAMCLNLGQYITAALATDRTHRLAEEIEERNRELTAANDELKVRSDELQQRSESLRNLADELEIKRVQVTESDRLKSEFLSNMSHELRTPLNSVLALSHLMISKGIGRDPTKELEYLQIIERNGRQLLNLINDILDLSKIESGRMELAISEFDVARVVHEAVETIRPLTAAQGLELTAEVSELAPMRSDREKVRQVLINLLGNARKFTEKGTIGLRVTHADPSVFFEVWDTGIGIPEDELSRIFDEFRQVDGSLARRHEGTGLGLAICERLARLLGGDLQVSSVFGQGSRFTLRVPLVVEGSAHVHRRPPSQPAAALVSPTIEDRATTRVLVVEDNPVASIQIRSALEDHGYLVDLTSSGPEALAHIERGAPDAIVLDLMMPGMDGFELLQLLRSRPDCRDTPVVILTAKELTSMDLARLNSNNVRELLQKGKIDPEELTRTLGNLVAKRGPAEPSVEPDQAEQRPFTATPPRKPRHIKGRPKLLLVEDKPDNMLTLRAVLEDYDAAFSEAVDGRQAVELAVRDRPDLIIMDIQLPHLSGIEATRQIRALERGDMPIIALSAKAMAGDEDTILAAGCDGYLKKPVDAEILLATLNRWLVREGG